MINLPTHSNRFPMSECAVAFFCTIIGFLWLLTASLSQKPQSITLNKTNTQIIELQGIINHVQNSRAISLATVDQIKQWQQHYNTLQPIYRDAIEKISILAPALKTSSALMDLKNTSMVMDDLYQNIFTFIEQDKLSHAHSFITSPNYLEHQRIHNKAVQRFLVQATANITPTQNENQYTSTLSDYIIFCGLSLLLMWSYVIWTLMMWCNKQTPIPLTPPAENESNNVEMMQSVKQISHDLRTPLNSLLVYAEELAQNEQGNLTEDQVFAAGIVHSNGYELLHLINDALINASNGKNSSHLTLEKIPVATIVSSLKGKFHYITQQKSIRLVFNVTRKCPKTLTTDIHKLDQILWKFLSNACAFSPDSTIIVTFDKAAKDTSLWNPALDIESTLHITVEDQGIGISKREITLMNKAFNYTTIGKGSSHNVILGSGLAISKQVARLLNAEIHVSSNVNNGAKFSIFLPEEYSEYSTQPQNKTEYSSAAPQKRVTPTIPPAPKQVTTQATKIPAKPKVQAPQDLHNVDDLDDPLLDINPGETILVIEDDLRFQRILDDMMTQKSLSPIFASTGLQGLKYAKEHLPAAIILDIELPDIKGTEVLARIKSDPKTAHIPVFIMSIHDDDIKTIRGQVIGYLTKPVTRSQLNQAFEQINDIAFSSDDTVLIVEDNKVLRDVIERMLNEKGVETLTAESGEEALQLIRNYKLSCMILDLGLPEMSGLDVLDAIAKDPTLEQPHVIVYTGNNITEEEMLKIHHYTDSFILKNGERPQQILNKLVESINKNTEIGIAEPKGTIKKEEKPAASPHTPDTSNIVPLKATSARKPDATEPSPATDEKNTNTATKNSSQGSTSTDTFMNKNVLIVDDDKRNIFALSRVLKSRGMNVTTAEDGQQALDKLAESEHMDIVLMDIMMPVMDGYEAIENIRKNDKYQALPVLAVTAKAMASDKKKCLAIGASDYISKPIDKDTLYSLMNKWLEKAQG